MANIAEGLRTEGLKDLKPKSKELLAKDEHDPMGESPAIVRIGVTAAEAPLAIEVTLIASVESAG